MIYTTVLTGKEITLSLVWKTVLQVLELEKECYRNSRPTGSLLPGWNGLHNFCIFLSIVCTTTFLQKKYHKIGVEGFRFKSVRFQVLNRNECEDGCLHRFKSASLLATNCNTEFSTASFPEQVDAVVNMKTPGISRMSADQPITTKFHLWRLDTNCHVNLQTSITLVCILSLKVRMSVPCINLCVFLQWQHISR